MTRNISYCDFRADCGFLGADPANIYEAIQTKADQVYNDKVLDKTTVGHRAFRKAYINYTYSRF